MLEAKEKILQEIAEFKEMVMTGNNLRVAVRQFVTDPTLPLADRWEVWCNSPRVWRQSESFVPSFQVEADLPAGAIFWYDDFYYERHETVDMQSVVDLIQIVETPGWTEELVNRLKEEIIQRDLLEFVFDW